MHSPMTLADLRLAPRAVGRVAGAFYLLNIFAGALTLVLGTSSMWLAALQWLAVAAYAVVTMLFYRIFRPVSHGLSLIAAVFSGAGLSASLLQPLRLGRSPIHPLGWFGMYCLMIGALILRSRLLPRPLGVLMLLGGAGWLTFLSPALAQRLAPYNFVPGMVGEGLLTLWLLAMGVGEPVTATRGATQVPVAPIASAKL